MPRIIQFLLTAILPGCLVMISGCNRSEELHTSESPAVPELNEVTHEKIKRLCAAGDGFAETKQYAEALTEYWSAWDLLPEPKTEWNAATWLLGSIGDVNYQSGDFEAGRDNLGNAMRCPDAFGNPFLHMRLGQCQFELGNFDRAEEELARAFIPIGKQIFEREDPKYLDFVKSKLAPPEGGWPDGW